MTFESIPLVFTTSVPVLRRYPSEVSTNWFAEDCGRVSHVINATEMVGGVLEFPVDGVCAGTEGHWVMLDLGESKNVREVRFAQLSNVKSVTVSYLHAPDRYTFKVAI